MERGTQTTKHTWLIIHRSHGTLAFIDASDLPKPLELALVVKTMSS